MLDGRWKKIALALRVYALALLGGLLCAGLVLAVGGTVAGAPSTGGLAIGGAALLILDGFAALCFFVGTGAIVVYATIPSESGAKTAAVVAASAALLQLPVALGSLVFSLDARSHELVPLLTAAEPLLALITLFAMTRSLRTMAGYIRADEVYGHAHMLSVGLGLLLVFLCGVAMLSRVAGIFAVVGAFAMVVFALMIAAAYVRLVFRAARAVDELIV